MGTTLLRRVDIARGRQTDGDVDPFSPSLNFGHSLRRNKPPFGCIFHPSISFTWKTEDGQRSSFNGSRRDALRAGMKQASADAKMRTPNTATKLTGSYIFAP